MATVAFGGQVLHEDGSRTGCQLHQRCTTDDCVAHADSGAQSVLQRCTTDDSVALADSGAQSVVHTATNNYHPGLAVTAGLFTFH